MSARIVHLIDDHDAFRESTLWLLEAANFTVFDYASGGEFLQRIDAVRGTQACVLSDVRMPQMSGLELLAELKRRKLALPLIFMTGHGDVPLAVEAMRNGASDFLEKPFSEAAIVAALDAAFAPAARDTVSSPREREPISGDSAKALATLSTRERQVFDLVTQGKSNKEIGRELFVSVKTVELYRARMMSKLSVKSLPELMRSYLSYL
jgi:two-component system, LuxR family, response regulator FixJ